MFEIKKNNSFNYAFEGEKALLQKNYKLALKLYNKAIQHAEKGIKHIDLYYSSRAEIKRHLNDIKGALKDINKAIEIQPNVYLYYFERHEIKNLLKDNAGAEEDLKIIFDLLDKNESSHIFKIQLAQKNFLEGNYVEALNLIDFPDNPKFNNEHVLNLKIEILKKLQDREKIILALDKLIEIFPSRINYYTTKIVKLCELEEFKKAENEIKLLIDSGKTTSSVYLLSCYVYCKLNNFDKAGEDFINAMNKGISEADILNNTDINILDCLSNPKFYSDEIEKILDLHNFNITKNIVLANKHFIEEHYEDAAKVIENIDNDISDSEQILNIKINIYEKLRMPEKTILALDKLMEISPDRINYLDHKASLLIDMKRYQEALNVINTAIQKDPDNGIFYSFKARVNYILGNKKEALKNAEIVLKVNSREQDIQMCKNYVKELKN